MASTTANLLRLGSALLLASLVAACATPTEKPPEPPPEQPVVEPTEPPPEPARVVPPEEPVKPPVPVPVPQPQVCNCPEPEPHDHLPVIGAVEYVLLDEDGPLLKARIDTGATTSSIDYHEKEVFERDGESWVKFSLRERETDRIHTYERELIRKANLKRHKADPVKRLVVKMHITIGEVERDIEVTLADRDDFDYPILIGRNFLRGKAVVDVSKRYAIDGGDEE